MLFGSASSVREPSLLTTAQRTDLDGDELLGQMHLELQDMLYKPDEVRRSVEEAVLVLANDLDLPSWLYPHWPSGRSEIWDHYGAGGVVRQVMALSQHYGIPTNGIDLTESLEVAFWFAVNRAVRLSEQHYRFERHHWWGGTPEDWPCIYLFKVDRLQREYFTLPEIASLDALRPHRQRAFLSFGGWGWHANFAAEELQLVVYLAPSLSDHDCLAGSHLFPGPREDPFYSELLSRKHLAGRSADSLWQYLPLVEVLGG
jgi:hypothetical protein